MAVVELFHLLMGNYSTRVPLDVSSKGVVYNTEMLQ